MSGFESGDLDGNGSDLVPIAFSQRFFLGGTWFLVMVWSSNFYVNLASLLEVSLRPLPPDKLRTLCMAHTVNPSSQTFPVDHRHFGNGALEYSCSSYSIYLLDLFPSKLINAAYLLIVSLSDRIYPRVQNRACRVGNASDVTYLAMVIAAPTSSFSKVRPSVHSDKLTRLHVTMRTNSPNVKTTGVITAHGNTQRDLQESSSL